MNELKKYEMHIV